MNRFASDYFDARLPGALLQTIEKSHIQDEAECGICCNHTPFALIAKNEKEEAIGVLQAYTAYAEIYIDDLWVAPYERQKGLGSALLHALEARFKNQGYNNINLVTNNFQAPDFYKKCGFTKEFTRINKKTPSLSKIFFIKYFDATDQWQGRT